MDNKEEKTFKDLFSSSDTESETTTITFSDILNDSSKEVENDSNEPTPKVTFDSLFDKIQTEEPKLEDTIFNQNSSENEEKNNESQSGATSIEFNSIFKQNDESKLETSSSIEEDDKTILKDSNINNIFEPIFTQEIDKKEAIDSPEIKFNPFFDTKETEESISSKTDIELEVDFDSNKESNETMESANPFFTSNNDDNNIITNNQNLENEEEKKEVLQIDKEQPHEFSFDNNPFIINNEENKVITENKITENPFFESTPIEIDSNKEKTISDNTNTIFEKKFKDENLFFPPKKEDVNNTIETSMLLSNDIAKKEETSVDISEDNSIQKSTSPFFEEEKKSEENPFFQNKLNLIENQVPNNSNTNIDTSKTKHYNVKVVKKKESPIKFILGVLSYALFIWLLLIGVTLLIYVLDIKIRAAKGDYSSPTFNAYVVLTGSMLPEIEVYDVVVTKKVDASKLKEGDVITFSSADSRFLGTIITHRIIKKNYSESDGYTFQTQGDNNNVADNALVPENNIYGKVILKIPKLGYLQEFLASDGGWIIVILIPCLTVMSYDIVKLIKGLKRKKYKNIKVQK